MKLSPLVIIAMVLLQACSDSRFNQKNAAVAINNVDIVYDECGNSDTTLLFLHGWCINKTYWEEQIKYFCDRYKVVVLDLPGFGQSGKNRTSWTFEQYTDDIHGFIKQRQLKNVILIGHSMSGDILLLTDTKYPGSVIGIVGVDNLQNPGTKMTEEQAQQTEGFFAMMDSSFSGTVDAYTRGNLFPPSADTLFVNRVIRDFKENDSIIAIKVLHSLIDISQKEQELMQQLSHKLWLVNSDVNATQVDSLKKYCKASAEVVYVKGTGHYPMIEKPAEFNEALNKVITGIGQK